LKRRNKAIAPYGPLAAAFLPTPNNGTGEPVR
jgi:hypothetical protein